MLTDANAYRTDGLITVELIGLYPTPCDEVSVAGYYPGPGTKTHFSGPGSARIFLREERKPGFEHMYCTPVLGKIWSINRVIPDNFSKTVEIFINNQFVRKIRITELTVHGIYKKLTF
jgi:hypothetical protein